MTRQLNGHKQTLNWTSSGQSYTLDKWSIVYLYTGIYNIHLDKWSITCIIYLRQ